MSKLLPNVSMVTEPLAGAVHRNHTDPPPGSPAWLGSPDCLVAPTLVPVSVPLGPLNTEAVAKVSFGGTCTR